MKHNYVHIIQSMFAFDSVLFAVKIEMISWLVWLTIDDDDDEDDESDGIQLNLCINDVEHTTKIMEV